LQTAKNIKPQQIKVNETLEELKMTPSEQELPANAEARDDAEADLTILGQARQKDKATFELQSFEKSLQIHPTTMN
jgi:hypothetical protein